VLMNCHINVEYHRPIEIACELGGILRGGLSAGTRVY